VRRFTDPHVRNRPGYVVATVRRAFDRVGATGDWVARTARGGGGCAPRRQVAAATAREMTSRWISLVPSKIV
jgi:hypothetical protein